MSPQTLTLRPETSADRDVIGRLHHDAFRGNAEADLVDALRRNGEAVLSLVAEEEGRVVGHVLYSRLKIETGSGPVAALALAPLAVAPARQQRGIGSSLVREAHRRLAAAGESIVFVVGEPAYYERFGFSAAAARTFETPYDGAHTMALAFGRDAPKRGIVRYPRPFAELA